MDADDRGPLITRRAALGLAAIGGMTVALAACGRGGGQSAAPAGSTAGGAAGLQAVAIDVHSDPGCGCCHEWVDYLRDNGYEVTAAEDPERAAFRAGLGVPQAAWSCHTGIVAGYAVEGHVPVEAIARLLAERPAAVGIAAPGMPATSPGMGGAHADWVVLPITLIANDGTLSDFEY